MEACCCVHPSATGSGGSQPPANRREVVVKATVSGSGCTCLQQLPVYSREQVSWHAGSDSCWIIIDNLVYDVTDFIEEHPGGSDVILENAGADCTAAFDDKGHSGLARSQLAKFLIGRLPARRQSECGRTFH